MSTTPDTDLNLDTLFLPAWAQEPASKNLYAHFEGEREDKRDRNDRGDRPPRRREAGPRGQGGPRPQGRDNNGPRPPRRDGPPNRDRHDRRDGPRPERRDAPAPAALPELNVAFRPDEKGVDSLTRQIKITGRAYPLFQIAQMILDKPERHQVILSVVKKADGQPAQALFSCALDDTLWLSEADAVAHVLNKHFGTFYQAERTAIDAPKGTYTFVAQCGVSGVVLGPPNHHDYQNNLRKLHSQRFARVPFEDFKARIKIVRDEAVVKQWLDEQSWKTEFICLNVAEPLKLGSRAEVEAHFRQTHLANIIKNVESFTMDGVISRKLPTPALQRLLRQNWEDQQRFPIQIATVLSQQFTTRGLQFFKVNKTVTHVTVARPHFLDLELTPVSESIRRIIDFINFTPRGTRRQLLNALAPSPAPVVPAEGKPAGEPAIPDATSPEATAVISELHWLIHQGHVIEFANGILETAKKPLPPKPTKMAPAVAVKAVAGTTENCAVESAEPVPVALTEPAVSAPAIQE